MDTYTFVITVFYYSGTADANVLILEVSKISLSSGILYIKCISFQIGNNYWLLNVKFSRPMELTFVQSPNGSCIKLQI